MKRETSMYIMNPAYKHQLISEVRDRRAEFDRVCAAAGARNCSVWYVENYLYIYAEFEDSDPNGIGKLLAPYESLLAVAAEKAGSNEDMRLMYHDIGVVRTDKSLIRRRVFATVLKHGCAEEYKARHQKLIDARGDKVSDGPETNFTIRCAKDKYIFGYCELVKSYDHTPTAEEKAATVAWETRQLEIMDWLTDDVDWITGQKHSAIELLYQQK